MAQHILAGDVSTSSSVIDKNDKGDSHFKWDCIRNFVYLADAFSSIHITFDIFSGVATDVSIYLFIIFALLIGMPYMCMDFFIKQYTGKIDFNMALNPLLKGVNCGILCVSAIHALVHANDLSDSVLFLMLALNQVPQWSECSKAFIRHQNYQYCIPTTNITVLCSKQTTSLKFLSTNINYHVLFITKDRSVITRKMFIIAIIWIVIFVITSVSDQSLIKFFYISFILRTISTIVATISVIISTEDYLNAALQDVMRFRFGKIDIHNLPTTSVLYVFGIGIVGVYDFGTLSPFTIVDNAVVTFTIVFTLMEFIRAILVRILYRVVKRCLKIKTFEYHYFFFGNMPLSADFLFSQRLFTIYLYANLSLGLCTHLAALTAALTKLIQSEFRTIKAMYISGMLCFFGFVLSVPLGVYRLSLLGFSEGLNNAMLVLAFLKTSIIMYIYGVQRFSNDVNFWLSFKPTRYWTLTWATMPVFLCWFATARFVEIINSSSETMSRDVIISLVVTVFIILVMIFIQIRTVVKYIADNNLTALIRSSNSYGPTSDDRKRRRRYDEALSVRTCTHNCVLLDNRFDCNHMPLTFKSISEEQDDQADSNVSNTSLTHIFEAGSSRKSKLSEMFETHSQN